jgi:Holliday junction resolvase-like predicted endonuclease
MQTNVINAGSPLVGEPAVSREDTMKDKVRKAACTFLKSKDCEVVESDFNNLIVAIDSDTLVFIQVGHSFGKPEDSPLLSMKEFEAIAFKFLSEHDEYVDRSVRFDKVDLFIVNNERALLKYTTNVIGEAAHV